MKLRRGETFTGKWQRNSLETSGVHFTFFFFFSVQRIESVYVVTLCVLLLIVIGMIVTRHGKLWCIKFSLCILSAEGIKAVLLLLTLKACRADLKPPVLCSVLVPYGVSRKEAPDFPVLSWKQILNNYSSGLECTQSWRVTELRAV